MARFLVTGGAGYVGSHLVAALLDQNHDVVVYDNLRQGHAPAVLPPATLIEAQLSDTARLNEVLADGPWDAVFHFAALSLVGESMQRPFYYLAENSLLGIGLIEACVRHGVRKFVLSSTANLFGDPQRIPIDEAERIIPGSPYGESKHMLERTLFWADQIHGLRSACLRYFNAAGADPQGRLGEDHNPETHLIPLVIDAALGRRPEIAVFGNDYPTPDGTCIRDYIHVTDLASAHILALDQLESRSVTYNLGNGAGHSVMQVIRTVEQISGKTVPARITGRRAGDPATLVAGSDRLRRETGWSPQFAELETIVTHALAWREAHPAGYADPRVQKS
jgi:UDP-glucose 4-epimerase